MCAQIRSLLGGVCVLFEFQLQTGQPIEARLSVCATELFEEDVCWECERMGTNERKKEQ